MPKHYGITYIVTAGSRVSVVFFTIATPVRHMFVYYVNPTILEGLSFYCIYDVSEDEETAYMMFTVSRSYSYLYKRHIINEHGGTDVQMS